MQAFDNFHRDSDMAKSGFGRTRYTVGIDGNHAEIVKTYEAAYFQVIDYTGVGHGHPDIGIAFGRHIYRLREIKLPDEELSDAQITFWNNWRGPPLQIIRSIDEALHDIAQLGMRR
jgi:hypothetical protein